MTSAPKKAKGRTLAEFWPLLQAENTLLTACESGDVAVISQLCPKESTPNNKIRASFLRFIALGGDERIAIHEHGIQLRGAWIVNNLDLDNATIFYPLKLNQCNFSTGINLKNSVLNSGLNLNGSNLSNNEMPSLSLNNASITGTVFLQNTIVTGEILLLGAQIDGDLDCSYSLLENPSNKALSADRVVIQGNVFLRKITVKGEIRFLGAQIGGDLDCDDATLENFTNSVLNATSTMIKGNAFLRKMTVKGEIRFGGAQIDGTLDCSDASLENLNGKALSADSTVIKGSICLRKTKAQGEIRFLGAQIDGDLDCSDASLENPRGKVLSADRAVIKGTVFLKKTTIKGEIRFIYAQLDRGLDCSYASLENPNGKAMFADGAIIKGTVFLVETTVKGEIRFANAQIDGNLDCNNASLENLSGKTLSADGAVITGALYFKFKTQINEISLSSTVVDRLVDNPESWGSNLELNGFVYGSLAGVAVTDAKTRLAWLDKQSILASGLDKHNNVGFRPQPWRQLQKVLREMGHTEDARQVAIAFENRLSEAGLIGQAPKEWNIFRRFIYFHLSKGFHFLFRVLIGYGYRPIRLVFWMIGVWLFCAALFWYSALQGVMGPSNPLIFQNPDYAACIPDSAEAKVEIEKLKLNQLGIKNGLPIAMDQIAIPGAGNWYLCAKLREEYTGLSPLAYSLDLILPLVNLQQDSDWAPLVPTPESSRWSEYTNITLKHITRFFVWFEILFGWLASLLMVAVVSGLTKRRED